MKTKNRSFLVIATTASLSLLTACGTVRQPAQTAGGSSPTPAPTGLRETVEAVPGRIVDAYTNAVTTHNVTAPLKQRKISDGGPAYDAFLYGDKVREYGVQAAVNSFESISNLTSTAKFYGIDEKLRDAIIERTAPQLTAGKPGASATPPPPAKTAAPGASGFAPMQWGGQPDPAVERLRMEVEAIRAKQYSRKKGWFSWFK